MKFLSRTLFFLLLGALPSLAAEHVDAALYWGRNAAPLLPAHLAPAPLAERLHHVFGFAHYELIKKDRIDLRHPWAQWFMPRRDFFLAVRPRIGQLEEPQLLDYEIYQDGFLLAKGKYEPSEGTPLFINGPDYKRGRLIFVLEAR